MNIWKKIKNFFKKKSVNQSQNSSAKSEYSKKDRHGIYYPEAIIPSESMNTKGKYQHGYPQGAIVHFTAGRSKGGLKTALNTFQGGVKDGFTFFVISDDGQVIQGFPLNEWGYHAGKSSANGISGTVSDELVGIEVCCAGKLEKISDNEFKSWFGEIYTKDEVRFNDGKYGPDNGYFHKYTEKQEQALIQLLLWLKSNNPSVFSFDFVLGHHEVSPGRKNDPEASLSIPMSELRKKLVSEYLKKNST